MQDAMQFTTKPASMQRTVWSNPADVTADDWSEPVMRVMSRCSSRPISLSGDFVCCQLADLQGDGAGSILTPRGGLRMLKTARRADVRADVRARRAEEIRRASCGGGSLRSQLNDGISLCQPPDAGYSYTSAALTAASRD